MKPASVARLWTLVSWTALVGVAPTLALAQDLPRDFALPHPLFAPDSAWNQTATAAAVLAESDQQILVLYRVMRGDMSSHVPPGDSPVTWPFMDVTYDEWTIPVFRMGAGESAVQMCDYEGNPGGNSSKVPIAADGTAMARVSAGSVRPSGPAGAWSDGHLVLFDPDSALEYDFWQATSARSGPCQSLGGGLTGPTILEAGAIEYFDGLGSGSNPDGESSARAMGPPLLAGMIAPEDIERGVIDHALALAIPGPRNTSPDPSEPASSEYFYPASTTETDHYSTDPMALRAGQRLRLKASLVDDGGSPIDEEQDLAPITRLFLAALRTYGAYVVDAAGGFTFYAEDVHTADLKLTQAETNALIGEPEGNALAAGKTRWEVVIEALNTDLWSIPIAYGPWADGQDPSTAALTTANFEVVEPATQP